MKTAITVVLALLLLAGPTTTATGAKAAVRCEPTRPDADGPFYRPGAPVRDRVGEGYTLSGRVLSTVNCRPLAGARVEIWLNGPDGKYSDRWRATLYADKNGRYRFESHLPVPYGSRPPHIHIIANAADHAELITQHYPQPGSTSASFDLVLIPNQ